MMKMLNLILLLAITQPCLSDPFIAGPSVVEISKKWNDVFPFPNFNRSVSVPMWKANLL